MSAVRPELGPTLPELAEQRLARPRRALRLAALAAVLLVAAVLAPLLFRGGGLDGREKVIHRGPPVFNVLHEPGVVRRMRPHAGELLRFEGGGGRLRLAFTARPLELPPFRGDVNGILPIRAQRELIDPRRDVPGFRLTDEGRARVNDAPGYQVGFRLRDGRRRTTGRDVMVLPAEVGETRGVLLSFRQTLLGDGPLSEAERERTAAVRSAFRSFRFGTERK